MTKGSASWRLLGDDDLAAFEAFLGPQAIAEDLTPAAVRSTATHVFAPRSRGRRAGG